MVASTSFVMIGSRMFSASTAAVVQRGDFIAVPRPTPSVWERLSESQKDTVRAAIRTYPENDGGCWQRVAGTTLRDAGQEDTVLTRDDVVRAAQA